MRYSSSFLFTLAAALLSDGNTLLGVSAKPSGGGGSRPSGGGGSRPSGGGGSSPSASRPSWPSPSSPSYPSASRPSSNTGAAYRPTAPTRPAFKSPAGPVSPTTRSSWNPNPANKPLRPSGAPTVRDGGGGWRSTAKRVALVAAGAAAVTIAAGYFFYGGRNSGPYCRGNDEDRFLSGRCPRGTSSTAHGCRSNIPLCPIPQLVRSKWNLGEGAPPKVDVAFDESLCSIAALPSVDATAGSIASNATNATATAIDVASNSTVKGVEGQSGLDACLRSVVAAGGCDSYAAGNLFLYDDASGACGCCSSAQVATASTFASAVYTYRPADDLTEAPRHCISGSTMYYPDVAGGPDAAHPCECGACSRCGAGMPRYVDWSGPFAVPDAAGSATFADAAGTAPPYDPVDTCLCDDAAPGVCESDFAALEGSPAAMVGAHHSNFVVGLSTAILLLGLAKRD